jgi:hypothetical protein
MVRSSDREAIENELLSLKSQLGLAGEIKWTRVRPFNWERVALVLDRFFDFVEADRLKLRYMWLDQLFGNPAALNDFHREFGYYILYYFFLVFCFGLPWHDLPEPVQVEFFPDTLPDQPEKRRSFRNFLLWCHGARRFRERSPFRIISVGDVDSKSHLLLQCVDVIIGAVGFRLNKLHEIRQHDGRRGEGTKVKELLYKRIVARIGRIDMAQRGRRAFGVGVNTSTGTFENCWRLRFRQWNFRRPDGFNPDWVRG